MFVICVYFTKSVNVFVANVFRPSFFRSHYSELYLEDLTIRSNFILYNVYTTDSKSNAFMLTSNLDKDPQTISRLPRGVSYRMPRSDMRDSTDACCASKMFYQLYLLLFKIYILMLYDNSINAFYL